MPIWLMKETLAWAWQYSTRMYDMTQPQNATSPNILHRVIQQPAAILHQIISF